MPIFFYFALSPFLTNTLAPGFIPFLPISFSLHPPPPPFFIHRNRHLQENRKKARSISKTSPKKFTSRESHHYVQLTLTSPQVLANISIALNDWEIVALSTTAMLKPPHPPHPTHKKQHTHTKKNMLWPSNEIIFEMICTQAQLSHKIWRWVDTLCPCHSRDDQQTHQFSPNTDSVTVWWAFKEKTPLDHKIMHSFLSWCVSSSICNKSRLLCGGDCVSWYS